MSGIAGIVNLDCAPVDRELVDRMACFLAYRGPDASGVWAQGSMGLVHTLFRTTDEAERERQPFGLDGQVWITAEARIDGRGDLLAELRGHGCDCARTAADPELILQAYAVWGEGCVEHLIGDFAFAIWDERKRRLLCARDHFGIKPFFYAQVGDSLVFSNTLDCFRIVPGISDELDEQFIADFLLFELSPDLDRTAFQAIRRLPPAHALIAADGQVRTRRYWSLPVEGPIHYRRAEDYVEHFCELFEQAVYDRLRTRRVALFMSGGLDSTSVAAVARRTLERQVKPFELRANTIVSGEPIPDEERRYAPIAAKALGMPIDLFAADDCPLYERWEETLIRPEPWHCPLSAMRVDWLKQATGKARVVLTGRGGDSAFSSLISRDCMDLFRQMNIGRLASHVVRYLMAEGRLSRLYIRAWWQRWVRAGRLENYYPVWFEPELERRLDLRARYARGSGSEAPPGAVRPEAYESLTHPFWPQQFEEFDSSSTSIALEIRHPFFDVRLLGYLLRLPTLPWCSDKELLRVAMRGKLPNRIRLRRKTPLSINPVLDTARRFGLPNLRNIRPELQLERFVLWEEIALRAEETDGYRLSVNLRPLSLNYWLKSRSAFGYKYRSEEALCGS